MNKFKTGVLLITVGLLSIVSAAGIWLYNRQDEIKAADASLEVAEELLIMINEAPGENSRALESLQKNSQSENPASESYVETKITEEARETKEDATSENTEEDEISSYIVVDNTAYLGVLNIPKFGLSLPVNVDWSYPALKRTPCRYSGSIKNNSLVIAAHNYNTHFGRIAELNTEDKITLTDAEGNEYEYNVKAIETVNPEDSYEVVKSIYDLTLFTCNYSGQARIVVRCERTEEDV